jgi:heme/copper-type cytochrome/quinol oxidase subunit 3
MKYPRFSLVVDNLKIAPAGLGFFLFVISEIFFFISIFWAFFHSSLAPTVELGAHWPPAYTSA